MKIAIVLFLLSTLYEFKQTVGVFEDFSPEDLDSRRILIKQTEAGIHAISTRLISECMRNVAKLERAMGTLRANNHILEVKLELEFNKTRELADIIKNEGRDVDHCLEVSVEGLDRIMESAERSFLECAAIASEFFSSTCKEIVEVTKMGKRMRKELRKILKDCLDESFPKEELRCINAGMKDLELRMKELEHKLDISSDAHLVNFQGVILNTDICLKEQEGIASKKVEDVGKRVTTCMTSDS